MNILNLFENDLQNHLISNRTRAEAFAGLGRFMFDLYFAIPHQPIRVCFCCRCCICSCYHADVAVAVAVIFAVFFCVVAVAVDVAVVGAVAGAFAVSVAVAVVFDVDDVAGAVAAE